MRVIAVGDGKSKALLIGFELDKVPYPAENLALLSERTGIPEENILYFSTHNHTSPVMGDRPEEGPNDIRRKPPRVQEATHRYERAGAGDLAADSRRGARQHAPRADGVRARRESHRGQPQPDVRVRGRERRDAQQSAVWAPIRPRPPTTPCSCSSSRTLMALP